MLFILRNPLDVKLSGFAGYLNMASYLTKITRGSDKMQCYYEESVVSSSTNEHCLLRPYLGRRRCRNPEADSEPSTRPQAFSLGDFPLHLDQMEQLGLNPEEYAVTMADALAFMHWIAGLDGNGVEFVLARPRGPPYYFCQCHRKSAQEAHPHNVRILGPHSMWILDFDMCRELTLDESGIEQACNAFWSNDPWYPQPGRLATADQKLWDTFELRFLTLSARALEWQPSEIRELPRLLMEKIKQTAMTASKDKVGNQEQTLLACSNENRP
ncbi:hypothetical protein MKX08_007507 [Trichoderma sp. CBMAI-0020]|nr:hypothetical protein MKX08_007507 [Trichoderma sp. CBMAI-0020]